MKKIIIYLLFILSSTFFYGQDNVCYGNNYNYTAHFVSVNSGNSKTDVSIAINGKFFTWVNQRNISIPSDKFNIGNNRIVETVNSYIGGSWWTYRYVKEVFVSENIKDVLVENQGKIFCDEEEPKFSVSARNATTVNWYKDSNKSILIGNTNVIALNRSDFPKNEPSQIYLELKNQGCTYDVVVNFELRNKPTDIIFSQYKSTYCVGENINITPSSSGKEVIYEWSDKSSFATLLGSEYVDSQGRLNYTSNQAGAFTYYVRAKSGDCYSSPQSVTFNVSNVVRNVSVVGQNQQVCNGTPVSFSASAEHATSYIWASDDKGVNVLGNNPTLSLDANKYQLGVNRLYLLVNNAGGCGVAPIEINFTVNPTPTNLQLEGVKQTYCNTEKIFIKPSAQGTGVSYEWSTNNNFTSLLDRNFVDESGNLSFIQSSTGTYTYYVRAKQGNCYSAPQSVTFTINQGVSNVQVANAGKTFCEGDAIEFLAGSPNATNYSWYKFSNGTGLLFNGANYKPSSSDYILGKETTVYLVASNGTGCSSDIIPVSFTVNPAPKNLTLEGETKYCVGDDILVTPIAIGEDLTYQWATASNFANSTILDNTMVDENGSLSFKSRTSFTRTYYVRAVNSQGCYSDSQAVTIVINTRPANLSITKLTNPNNSAYCQGTKDEIYIANGRNITEYKWFTDITLTKEVIEDYITGNTKNVLTVNPSKWEVGYHSIYVVGYNANGCVSDVETFSFNILKGVTPVAVNENNFNLCKSEEKTIKLENPNRWTIEWFTNSIGTNKYASEYIFDNGNRIVIKGENFNTGVNTLYYKVSNAEGCQSELTAVNFTVLEAPHSLTVTNNNAVICKGKDAVFEASATNSTMFEWYKDYQSSLVADPKFVSGTANYKLTIPTADLEVGTYTYYVIAKSSSGCKTEPFKVTFSVKDVPNRTTLIGEKIFCQNELITFELLNQTTKTFKWFTDANGLNPLDAQFISNDGASVKIPAQNYKAGTYTLYFYSTNLICNSEMQSVTFTVNESPSELNIIGNEGEYCYGNMIDIAIGSTGGATSYQWFLDSKGSILVDKIYLTGTMNERFKTNSLMAGNYVLYVRAINEKGCQSALKQITFKVNPTPVVQEFQTSKKTIQQGETIDFKINAKGYDRWRVLFNGIPLYPQEGYNNGQVVNYVLTKDAQISNQGTYTLEISNGTCTAQSSTYIYVLPKVVITHNKTERISKDNGEQKVILNQHESIIFDANSDNNLYSEKWYYGDGFENSTISGNHFFNQAGEFIVKLELTNKNTEERFLFEYEYPILVKPVDNVEEIKPTLTAPTKEEYIITPNPFKSFFKVITNGASTGDIITMRIFDLKGVSLFSESWLVDGVHNSRTFYNPMINAPQGTYVVVIHNQNKKSIINTKIIKK